MTAKSDRNDMSLTQLPEAWFDAFSALSGVSQDIASRWTKGISDQVQRNLDLCSNLAACRDAGEAVGFQQRWLSQTIEGVSADVKDLQNLAAGLSRQWMASGKGKSTAHARTQTATAA